MYHALIQSHLAYGILAWGGNLSNEYVQRILRLQKKALRIITRRTNRESCRSVFKDLKVLTFPNLYILNAVCYAYEAIQSGKMSTVSETNSYALRNADNRIFVPRVNLKKSQKFISNSSCKLFNKLPQEYRSLKSITSFRNRVSQYLICNVHYSFSEFFGEPGSLT